MNGRDSIYNRLLCIRSRRGLPFFLYARFYLDVKGRNLDTEKLFAYRAVSRSFPGDFTILCDSYAWSYRELATLLTLSESLAEVGREPLSIGPMRKNLTIELS